MAGERSWLAVSVEAYRRMLTRLISEDWKPDIIHADCVEFAGIVTHRLASELAIPWVLKENQVFVLSAYSEYRRRLMADAMRAATAVVAVSQHQMRSILLHGIFRPMVVVGNLIDEVAFPFAEPTRASTRFSILTVTYPSPIKDCETFFRAIAILLERGHQDIEVTVIGNKSFRAISEANTSEFERLAAENGVSQVCRLIAYVARSDLPKYYAECDVFVSTSIAETFGVAVREAMTVGRPVVCTASGGVEDDLSPVNGIKVSIQDPEAVAEALIAVKTGRMQFNPIKVRNSVVAAHGRRAFLEKTTAVYDGVMASSQG
jgi:glycosyltransferase involved in cell wall biosynthesis